MERSTRSKAKSSPAQPVVSNALLEVIEETIDILHTATYPSTQVCRPLTKHNVMDIALPTKLYEEYREEGGPVRNRTNFTRPITQIIAIRDAGFTPLSQRLILDPTCTPHVHSLFASPRPRETMSCPGSVDPSLGLIYPQFYEPESHKIRIR